MGKSLIQCWKRSFLVVSNMPDGLRRNQLPLPLSFQAQTESKKAKEERILKIPEQREVWISQGTDSHFLNQSLYSKKAGNSMFKFWFCLLSKSFNLRSPSVFICKQPFLNDLTGFSGRASHAGSRSSLGLPVPLASPGAHWCPPPLPRKVICFHFTQLYFSDISLCFEPVSWTRA